MNKRYGGDSRDVSWGAALASLILKSVSAKNLDKCRAIALDTIALKLYSNCLLLLLRPLCTAFHVKV